MTDSHFDEKGLEEVSCLLHAYFPDMMSRGKTAIKEQLEAGEILYRPNKVIPYLQTAFFEEHRIELQPDESTRVFFANMLDDEPDDDDENVANAYEDDSDYEMGSYLKDMDSFLLTPLTPGIGNARVRSSKHVVARCYIGTMAVEFGCTFRDQDMAGNMPVLRFDFPEIAVVNRAFRPFRVKVVSGVDARILLLGPTSNNASEASYQIYDICATGVSFLAPVGKHDFEIGKIIRCSLQVSGLPALEIEGTVRQASKLRGAKGGKGKDICGVQFDLKTRSLATETEQLTAAIQRMQLREIAEKTAFMKGVRLIK
jgi:hypothetical protein